MKKTGFEKAVANAVRFLLKKARKQQKDQAAAVRPAPLEVPPPEPQLEQAQPAALVQSHQYPG